MGHGCKKKILKLEIRKNGFKKYYPDLQTRNEFGGERKCLSSFKS